MQEVPSSNLGGPTKYPFKDLRTGEVLNTLGQSWSGSSNFPTYDPTNWTEEPDKISEARSASENPQNTQNSLNAKGKERVHGAILKKFNRRFQCKTTPTSTNPPFERSSKRRRGFPSETNVKRGLRIVHGEKELIEKLGGNDLCPCGSGRRFQEVLPRGGKL